MARNTSTNKEKTSAQKASGNLSKSGTRKSAAARSRAVEAEPRILDDRTRRDIVGVGFIILGIVLFIAAAAPAGAIVTDFLSESLHVVFGVGCYIMPFFLVAIGGAVLYRMQSERMSLRVTLGLSLILVALLGIIALFTPTTGTGPAALFDRIALVTHGGYVGAALAWVGLTLFGPAISAILLIGVAIVGVIVIGFSISAFLEKVRARYDLDGEGAASLIPDAFGSMRRGRGKPPLTTMAESADLPPAAHGAPTARISLDEQPRRRSRGAAADTVSDAAVTRQLGAQKTDGLVPIQAPDPREVAEVEDISAVEPAAPMTRKLGRRRQEAEVAEREAAKTKPVSKKTAPKKKKEAPAQPISKDGFQLPPMTLLATGGARRGSTEEELRDVAAELQGTLEDFGVMASVVGWVEGPTVTLFKVDLPSGVRVSKVTNLTDDIALALAAPGVRIFAPIPGTNYVGIEVPNRNRQMVYLPDVLAAAGPGPLQVAIGEDVEGHAIVHDLAKMPHVLIAGTTGSGKSVCTNSLIISLLYKATPDEVRLIMVDPKMVELGIYNGIPHLLIPVVTDPKKAAGALQWAVTEMMKRYRTFAEVGVRDLAAYNALAARTEGMTKMPQIVVVIDELADLMLVAAKEVEESICRVAQMGRASGMHLIIATQRPSADVITGLMKANIPSRIAFAVASSLESRIILDTTGAEKLVGRGDMLYFPLGSGKPTRVQGCLISDQEVAAVVDFVKQNSGDASYDDQVMQEIEQHAAEKEKGSKGVGGSAPDEVGDDYDELLPAAIEVVVETGMASVSMLQRRLKLGYSRAARLVDQMEEKGVVGPFEGSKPRQVLITKDQWQEMQFKQGMVDAAPEPVPDELEFEGDAIPQSRDLPPFDMED